MCPVEVVMFVTFCIPFIPFQEGLENFHSDKFVIERSCFPKSKYVWGICLEKTQQHLVVKSINSQVTTGSLNISWEFDSFTGLLKSPFLKLLQPLCQFVSQGGVLPYCNPSLTGPLKPGHQSAEITPSGLFWGH